MAWLESTTGGTFRIGFRFGGRKHHLPLGTGDRREAEATLGRFEANARLLDLGVIAPPPDGADVGTYVVSAGKLDHRPSQIDRAVPDTVGGLIDAYLAGYPKGAKEATTWRTERIHLAHLRRLVGPRLLLDAVTSRTLQEYIDARSADVGPETIRKEVGTFVTVWNRWAIPQGMTARPAPAVNLHYPKSRSKPPFQIRDQIERQIARGGTTADQERELWECLFLTLPEIDEVLEFARRRERLPHAYPMFVIAAHTGARRSEIRRALVTDFDFDTRTVLIREKKKDHDKVETYRTVPMSPLLERVMRTWLADHPGGRFAVCTGAGAPITEHYATKLVVNTLKKTRWSVIPGWHCFRHSFISNCAARGVDQRLIDQWVGHTTEAMRRRYRHLVPAVLQAALHSVFGTSEASGDGS